MSPEAKWNIDKQLKKTGEKSEAEVGAKKGFDEAITKIKEGGDAAKKSPEKGAEKFAEAIKAIQKFFDMIGKQLISAFGAEKMRRYVGTMKDGWIKMWLEDLLDSDEVQWKVITDTVENIEDFDIKAPESKTALKTLRAQAKEIAKKTKEPYAFEEHIQAINDKFLSQENTGKINLELLVTTGKKIVEDTKEKIETAASDPFNVRGLKIDGSPVAVPQAFSESLTIQDKEKNTVAKLSSKRLTLPNNKKFEILFGDKTPKSTSLSTRDSADVLQMDVTMEFETQKISLKLKTMIDKATAITGESDVPVEIPGTGVFLKYVKSSQA